jgi:hypothetical protein
VFADPSVKIIDHTPHQGQKPQTNGIVERFHRTVLNEFYMVVFRRKIYSGIEQLQATSIAGFWSTMSCDRMD